MAIITEREKERTDVRNSPYRDCTAFMDPLVPIIYDRSDGKIKAWHISLAALVAGVIGTEIQERQNRAKKHTIGRTAVAIILRGLRAFGDGLDGKYARYERSFMPEKTDEEKKQKDRHEEIGQALDASFDGLDEAHARLARAITAWMDGDAASADAALNNLRKTNRPRTAKAIAAANGVAVPETYKPWDPRFYGTSLGRILPDIVSTFFHRICGIPAQRYMDNFTSLADDAVTLGRLAAIITKPETLSEKDARHGLFRAKVLGAESIFFSLVAYGAKKLFLTGGAKKSPPA